MITSCDNDGNEGAPRPPGNFLEHGNVEPHAPLLIHPADGQLLYKIMKVGDVLRSVEQGYLHFQRVDSYKDFPTADAMDGEQPARDRALNAGITFERAPEFSAADYYDNCRARTYASSFSTENSPVNWERYGTGDPVGKVCVVFQFGKLRAVLNETIGNEPGRAVLMVGSVRCAQIFAINYGMINYVEHAAIQANAERLVNPIIYSYIKDRESFGGENEFRITLSTLGVGNFALADHTIINFPPSMQVSFDFKRALGDGTIVRMLCESEDVIRHLERELERSRIRLRAER